MILDYNFSKYSHNFSLSYIDDTGNKKIMDFGAINHFKTFYYTPTGTYTAWNGAKCDIKYTEKPSKFDLIRFIRELPEDKQKLLRGTVYPRMYTFDIENTFVAGEEPDPVGAKNDITTISVVSPELKTIVLGTLKLDDEGLKYVSDHFREYMDGCAYFHTLDMSMPEFKYLYFEHESDMLEFFLKEVVAKVPILAGWNSIGYDWIYICNRIKNFYPDLSMKMSSIVGECKSKTYVSMKNDKISYPAPVHTMVLDLMDYVKYDKSVMPIKESMSLNYLSHESIGVEKIEYDGDLMDLLRTDPAKYVYYNAIDSILVRMIEYRFKQLDLLYMYSIILEDKFENVDLTIPPTETAVFNDFYENNLQVVNEEHENVTLPVMGAYVKEPLPGKYEYISCNDFASLYPSTVITCNISFENFVGAFYDEHAMKPYRDNPIKYLCIGCNVHENVGTVERPKAGKLICKCIDYKKLMPYVNDPKYFVTVNAHVYRNDRQYSFSRVQSKFKAIRNVSKYLSKDLDATVLLDIEHLLEGKTDAQMHTYSDRVVESLKGLGYDVRSGEDLKQLSDLDVLKRKVSDEIAYLVNKEQSVKILMNGMYGGTTHPAFYWFNQYIGNDITGEARSVIHLMERHFETFWNENWALMDEYHKKWGIEIDKERIPVEIQNSPSNSLVTIIYGDTDSLYISYAPLLNTIKGFHDLQPRQKMDIIARINTDFLNKHNFDYITDYYAKRHAKSIHEFELETIARGGIWLNVKKRYAQVIMWKDGKIYDEDEYTVKSKGLETIKSSYPALARKCLKGLVKDLIMSDSPYLLQELNLKMLKVKHEFMTTDIENICGSMSVHNYTKYIIDDHDGFVYTKGAPFHVRALAYHNYLIHKHGFNEDPVYGGKMKWYKVKKINNQTDDMCFAFQSRHYPKWADKYAPIDREAMFVQTVLEPFNRILEGIGMNPLRADGSIQAKLF